MPLLIPVLDLQREAAVAVAAGIRGVINGASDKFLHAYSLNSSGQECWFIINASRPAGGEKGRFLFRTMTFEFAMQYTVPSTY